MDFLVTIKASKQIRDYVYSLCNGIRREENICEFLLINHPEFTDINKTRISVNYHIVKLKAAGLIYIKDNGRILDLDR
jgi:hypothetical protein|tara:strand:+ start:45351 stop:45584 length:234 start_codon:yes stop_codon:yes gene_type:complete